MDYSGLKRQHMSARGTKERDALDADFKCEIEEREKALSRAAPNLKALQQFEAVKVTLPPYTSQKPCPLGLLHISPAECPPVRYTSGRYIVFLASQSTGCRNSVTEDDASAKSMRLPVTEQSAEVLLLLASQQGSVQSPLLYRIPDGNLLTGLLALLSRPRNGRGGRSAKRPGRRPMPQPKPSPYCACCVCDSN